MTTLLNHRIILSPKNFVGQRAPSTKVVLREVQIVVCPYCDVELDYDFPRYTGPCCEEQFTFIEEAVTT